ncbi:DUF389 domain-containing protein [Arthrobacter sp. Z1-15]
MNNLSEMRENVFFEGVNAGVKFSRFWLLLCLSAVIASAGLVGDSTATVIGAMIIAPLMTPILGIVLATVTGDRRNLLLSWGLVLAGAAAAVAVGYLVGLVVTAPVLASTNAQIAGRVSPGLIDLLAALATGVVGAIGLVRRDVSDAVPGVAIAISLVPPLCVAGLTLESGAWGQTVGALVLFAANVTAILATGVIVLTIYRIGSTVRSGADTPSASDNHPGWNRPYRAMLTTLTMLVVVGIPLALSSIRATGQELLEGSIRQAAEPWAAANGWGIAQLQVSGTTATLSLAGPMPVPDTADLVASLESQGIDPSHITLEFIPAYEVHLEPSK